MLDFISAAFLKLLGIGGYNSRYAIGIFTRSPQTVPISGDIEHSRTLGWYVRHLLEYLVMRVRA